MIVVEQTAEASGGPVTSIAMSFGVLPDAGNAVIVPIAIFQGSPYAEIIAGDVTDNQSNTYALAFAQTDNTGAGACAAVAYDESIGSPSGTFTVTVTRGDTGNWYCRAEAMEVSGLQSSGSLDIVAETAAISTTPTVTSAATTVADELVIGVLATDDGSADTGIDEMAAPYTTLYLDNNGGGIVSCYSAYKIVSVTGTQNFNGGTLNVAENHAIGIATFKGASVNRLIGQAQL